MDDRTMIVIGGTLASLVAGVALILLLRKFVIAGITGSERLERMDLSWREYRPFHRLLDPADFEFLRRQGIDRRHIEKLLSDRRRIYRRCLRNLAQDFDHVHRTLNLILIHSPEDRPELASALAKQRITFYRNLTLAHVRLFLHGCGLEKMPAIDLVKPLEMLQAQLQMFAPATAAATA